MSLFNKLLKKKQELEKELSKSKAESTDEDVKEVSKSDISETDTDEQQSDSLYETDEINIDLDAYDEDEDDEDDDDIEVTEEEMQATIEKVTNILMDNGFYDSDEEQNEEPSVAPEFRYLQEKLHNLHIDRTLFIVPVTKKDDDLSKPIDDHVIHVSFNAAKMIESDNKPENMDIMVDLPAGYSLPDDTEPVTEMQLRKIVNQNDNNSEWLPVFLSYQNYLNMFGGTFRLQLVTFDEVYRFIDQVSGIVIEPGALNLLLKKKNDEKSDDQSNQDSQSDEKATTIFMD